jgi:multidrug efflux pump
VVDDAIVVLENIMRHVEAGMKPRAAALQGAREIGFTVLSISVSLVAVFLPILLMGGIIGRLFREFAAVLTAAVVISLVVSLTTTPMMCGALLRHEEENPNRRRSIRERALDGMTTGYRHGLGWVLRHPFLMLLVTLGTVALSVKLFMVVPKGFFPQQDTGRLAGGIQAAQDISFQSMSEKLTEVVSTIAKDSHVASVLGFTGGGGGGGGAINTGRLFITLTPPETRNLTSDEVIARLRGPLASIPGAPTFLQSVQDLRIGGRPGNAQYQFTLQAGSVQELAAAGSKVLTKFRSMPELADVSTDQQDRGLEATLVVDRDTAYRLGISAKLLDDTLYDAFGQRQVAITYTPLNQYHLVMEVAPQYWQNPEILRDLFIRSADGTQVPLSAFTHFEPTPTNLAVNHQGQFPSVTLSFNLAPGVALGDAVVAINAAIHDLGLPQSVHGSFAGAAQAFQASLSSEPVLILAALLTVYLVLGILYESYIHPITILSTLPSAGVGALLALILTGTELNVMGLIGIILLIGIVKKNAIMMIDFALEAERGRNIGPKEAIYEACLLRFRPIMMTTLAAMFGALPLALSRGVGAELRRPLGIAIVGGLIVSQALTLFTTPVIYLYLDRLRAWTARARSAVRRRVTGAPTPREAHTP